MLSHVAGQASSVSAVPCSAVPRCLLTTMQAAQQPHPPRTSQACRHCRSLKARCLPSGEPGTCQRSVLRPDTLPSA